jgi:hypothetical protein
LSCTRTRLLNRVEPVTGRTLSLVSADVLVQIRPDLRFVTSPSDLPRHKRLSASMRFEVCSHLATSKLSTSSPQCRQTSPVAFSSTASNVPHARPSCTQLGRDLSSPSGNIAMCCTPSLCTSLPCSSMLCIAPPPSSIAGPALASALPNYSRTRLNCVRPWPAPHLLRPPFFCSQAATLRPQLHLRLRRVPALLAARAFTLLRRRLSRLSAMLLHRARAAPPARYCSFRAVRFRPGPAPATLTRVPHAAAYSCASAGAEPAPVPALQRAPSALHRLLRRSLGSSLPRAQLPRALAWAHSVLAACSLLRLLRVTPATRLTRLRLLGLGPSCLLRLRRATAAPTSVHPALARRLLLSEPLAA